MFDELIERTLCCFNKLGPNKEKVNDSKPGVQKMSFRTGQLVPLDIAELDRIQVDAAFPRFVVSTFSIFLSLTFLC
ncbi:unnamed protein product [Enterobius vermicularis]|uniref:Uncharacterized protein n=1 Tax=Enterobius vermicularis TaxID=51028 RepID=A0A0N4V9T5_ENTVE|nr:unnamed protein product [Enterobius vermicularis]